MAAAIRKSPLKSSKEVIETGDQSTNRAETGGRRKDVAVAGEVENERERR